MKRKHWFLTIAAVVVIGGLWLARQDRRPEASDKSGLDAGIESSNNQAKAGEPKAGHTLRPPDQTRRFREFTPEQRVEFARKGHGPGG
jgi:hypothetical protein